MSLPSQGLGIRLNKLARLSGGKGVDMEEAELPGVALKQTPFQGGRAPSSKRCRLDGRLWRGLGGEVLGGLRGSSSTGDHCQQLYMGLAHGASQTAPAPPPRRLSLLQPANPASLLRHLTPRRQLAASTLCVWPLPSWALGPDRSGSVSLVGAPGESSRLRLDGLGRTRQDAMSTVKAETSLH